MLNNYYFHPKVSNLKWLLVLRLILVRLELSKSINSIRTMELNAYDFIHEWNKQQMKNKGDTYQWHIAHRVNYNALIFGRTLSDTSQTWFQHIVSVQHLLFSSRFHPNFILKWYQVNALKRTFSCSLEDMFQFNYRYCMSSTEKYFNLPVHKVQYNEDT